MERKNVGSQTSQDSLTGRTREEAIERLYDVALDPTRYETLLDVWETAIAPLREGADFSSPRLLDDATIASHFDRAGAFLDRLDQSSTQVELSAALAPFDKVAAFLFDDNHKVAAANPAANALLGLKVGAPLASMLVNAEDVESILTTAHAFAKREDRSRRGSASSIPRKRAFHRGSLAGDASGIG